MRSCVENHSHLLAPAIQDQAGAADCPCRGNCIAIHQTLPCVRRLSWVLRKNRGEHETLDFPTDLQQTPDAWNTWGSGKMCIQSRSYGRVHHPRSHRSTKYLHPIFVLAFQYSPPLSSIPPPLTFIRLSVKVCLWKKNVFEFLTMDCLYPIDKDGKINLFYYY